MGGARHPKPYNEGPRRQVTVPWKRRVLAKLEENERAGRQPFNIEQLRNAVEAPKGSINGLLSLEKEQFTSTYVDEINETLGIAPPLIEEDGDDDDIIRGVELLRALTPEERKAMLVIAQRLRPSK